MATQIRGYKLKDNKLARDLSTLDAAARARAAGKPPKRPRRWKVRAAKGRR